MQREGGQAWLEPGASARGSERLSLDEQLLMTAVAQRYYFDDRTRVQIAEEFGISRFKVTRMLETAVSTGLVRIQIGLPDGLDAALSLELADRFGLKRAIVATPNTNSRTALRDALGRAAAKLLTEVVTANDVLGVTSGRTIDAMVRHLTELAGCDIIQLTGMSGHVYDNPVEVLRRVAVLSGGEAQSIYAPVIVATAEAARALKTDRSIADTFSRFESVTIALASIGSYNPPDSRLYDALSDMERAHLAEVGVVADIGGSALLNATGEPVQALDDRLIGASFDQFDQIPHVILLGGGPKKANAILAALRSGLVTTLITDESVARTLLAKRGS